MEKLIISKRICDQKVEVLHLDDQIMDCLKEKKIETIRDFIQNEKKVPVKQADVIKEKIKYLALAVDRQSKKSSSAK